jgi:hypothetical protein
MSMRYLICLVGLSSIAACQRSPEPLPKDDPDPGPAATASPLPSEPGQLAVDPPTRSLLPRLATERIARSPLPVLLPRAEPAHLEPELVRALLPSAIVVVKDAWYSVSLRARDLTVTLGASRRAHRNPHVGPVELPHRLRGTAALITQNEGIWSATWFEHGASYTAEIECADPQAAACQSQESVAALVEDLVYVGGAVPPPGGAKP